jgi:hypothetical protein
VKHSLVHCRPWNYCWDQWFGLRPTLPADRNRPFKLFRVERDARGRERSTEQIELGSPKQ